MLLIQMRISRKGQTKRQIHQFSRMECAGKNRPLYSRRSRMHLILKKEDKAAGESREKGVIVAHGRAKYEWKDDESMNYFVTLKMNMERRHSGERP